MKLGSAFADAGAVSPVGAGPRTAQQYPARPVKVLVTIPPGGAPDIAARLLAQRLTETMGQSFFIENRSGANGNVAADMTAHAEPDGYTLIMAADSLITINPHVYSLDAYRHAQGPAAGRERGVEPVLPLGQSERAGQDACRSSSNTRASRSRRCAYASGGNGSQHQLGIEMLKQRAGIDLLHVPYRGGAPAGMATVAGETQVVLAGASNAGLLQAGKLRGLATTGKKRSPMFPDMPTIGEFYPGYDLTIWLGLFGPPGTARADRDAAAQRGAERAGRAGARAEAQCHRQARAADPVARGVQRR